MGFVGRVIYNKCGVDILEDQLIKERKCLFCGLSLKFYRRHAVVCNFHHHIKYDIINGRISNERAYNMLKNIAENRFALPKP
jgi:hypothetical protein